VTKRPAPSSPPSFLPILLILIALPLLGCNLFDLVAERFSPPDEMSLEEALQVTPVDSRPTVLEEMGPPDAFSITFEELEGQTVRWETWSYFDFESRFDFIDGELLWTIDLEPVPDGSISAYWYDPDDFQAGMTPGEVKDLLAGQELLEVDLDSLDLQGSLILAGDQILLGFEDDRLVYVETLILSPDPEGQPLAVSESTGGLVEPQVQGTTSEEKEGETLTFLQDDFESQTAWAKPLLGASYMEYGNLDGYGALTTHYPQGMMIAYYDQVELQDFVLKVEINTLSLAEGAKAGVMFRAENPAGGVDHYLTISVMPSSQQIRLEGWKDGEWAVWDYQDIPQKLVPADGIYHLDLDCQGSSVTVYLEDGLAAKFTTNLIEGPGYFGLVLVSPQNPETVLFDNLLVIEHP
jgi:hypothetical protein